MCISPIVFGNWNNALLSGPRARNLNNVRGNSNDNVGGRDYKKTSRLLTVKWNYRDMVSLAMARNIFKS
jgi:hypothetical protein